MVTAAYAFAHFAVDFGCAYAMFSACQTGPVGFLLYNFFAFAMQMPLGLLADRIRKHKAFAFCGIMTTAFCCLFSSFGTAMACLLGLGNGLFHIGGGLDILDRCSERAAPLGLFVSPGALGVFLGTMLGKVHFYPLSVLTILLLAALSILCCVRKHRFVVASFSLPHRTVLLPATLLFCVVVLRSFGGTAAQFPWKTGIYAWFFVFAVVAGKALGGILADRFGSVRVSAVSLLAASICFLFGSYAIMGLLALLMFNMTMPITLLSLSRKMPGTKGFSFGLLTFALFLGFLPFYLGAKGISSLSMVAVAAASALLLLPALKEGEL